MKNVQVTVKNADGVVVAVKVMPRMQFGRQYGTRMSYEELKAFCAGDRVTLAPQEGVEGSVSVELVDEEPGVPARVRMLRDEAAVAGDLAMVASCRSLLAGELVNPDVLSTILEAIRVPVKAFWRDAAGGDRVPMTLREVVASANAVASGDSAEEEGEEEDPHAVSRFIGFERLPRD